MKIKSKKQDALRETRGMIGSLSQHCAPRLALIRNIKRPTEGQRYSCDVPTDDPTKLTEVLNWLIFENINHDANIYIHPPRGSEHPLLFLDDLAPEVVLKISKKYAAIGVETSPCNCQVWLLGGRDLGPADRQKVQKELIRRIGADPGCVDADHLGRLAGFRQCKPGENYGFLTRIIADTLHIGQHLDVDALLLFRAINNDEDIPQRLPSGGAGGYDPDSAQHHGGGGNGEHYNEFAWACHFLRRGWDEDEIVGNIAAHALDRGKRRTEGAARKYAERTVRHAKERLRT